MTIVAFHTPDPLYTAEAARLRRSLERLGLPHLICKAQDMGSWDANARQTAAFIASALDTIEGPVVYLDADAVVHHTPELLLSLSPDEWDIAGHWFYGGKQLANGTLWLGNTEACRAVIEDYRRRAEAGENPNDEQKCLQDAVASAVALRMYTLPAEYCYIHGISQPVDPVIEHMQASRERNAGSYLEARRQRILEIED